MPLMDGYESTERIRQSEKNNKYHRTYICALSASKDEGICLWTII